jgi:hypothetical protein
MMKEGKMANGIPSWPSSFDLVELNQGRIEIAQVVVVLCRSGLQVEPGALEAVASADADRADDIGSIAGCDLGGQGVVSGIVIDDFEDQFDLSCEALNSSTTACWGAKGGFIRTSAQTNKPANLDFFTSNRLGRRLSCQNLQLNLGTQVGVAPPPQAASSMLKQ